MKKILLNIGVLLSVTLFSSSLLAATGEWWEITAKVEMEGFAMPAQTSKICLPKGGESDPRYTQGEDSNCTMTDVKHSGNTVKFKSTCVDKGETMHMVGETSHSGSSFKSNVKMSGKSEGESVNTVMTSSGKRIGGACDPDELFKKAKAQGDKNMAAVCDTSKYTVVQWVTSSELFLGNKPSCPGKKEALCKSVRNDAPKDVNAFMLLKGDKGSKDTPTIAQACNIDVDSMNKQVCKAKARSGPLHFLEANCPAEAKAYRELQRKQADCAGRGFTSRSDQMKKCMGGEMIEDEAVEERPAETHKSRAAAESDNSPSSDSSSDAVREGTKALKGLFGF